MIKWLLHPAILRNNFSLWTLEVCKKGACSQGRRPRLWHCIWCWWFRIDFMVRSPWKECRVTAYQWRWGSDVQVFTTWELGGALPTLCFNPETSRSQDFIVHPSVFSSGSRCSSFVSPPTFTITMEPGTLPPRYSTFLRVFKSRWSDILKFRSKNLYLGKMGLAFKTCQVEVCFLRKHRVKSVNNV